jgi:putative ABC transport system permease protein
MIRFLLKGLLRDRNRSLLPFLVTAIGVMLTVVFHCWITGVIGNSIEFNAKFSSGHVKIMTRAYDENSRQMPIDLAILGVDTLNETLSREFPEMEFVERIYFAGLIDVADEDGETRAQGPSAGIAIDLLSGDLSEVERLNIASSIKSGSLPVNRGEALLSRAFARKLQIEPGDTLTLVGTTMYNEFTSFNFVLSGTIEFGTTALDRGTLIVDIQDARDALNMTDAAGEILGFSRMGHFNDEEARLVAVRFNDSFELEDDEFSLILKSLEEQNSMGFLVAYSGKLQGIVIFVFVLAMALILWNAGLLGGLRRYGEFGMRLAIGEEKGHVYKTMLIESAIIGLLGSLAGIALGLGVAWYLETYGIDLGIMMKNASIMMPQVFKARITPEAWYIGFIPGVLSSLFGTMLAGVGIYKRQTAQLFKELQA